MTFGRLDGYVLDFDFAVSEFVINSFGAIVCEFVPEVRVEFNVH